MHAQNHTATIKSSATFLHSLGHSLPCQRHIRLRREVDLVTRDIVPSEAGAFQGVKVCLKAVAMLVESSTVSPCQLSGCGFGIQCPKFAETDMSALVWKLRYVP
jgi:hypothetical protein